jgi:hypothetical protein
MSDHAYVLIIALAIVYLPLIVADLGSRGGGIWKFLAFMLCTIALGAAFLSAFGVVIGVVTGSVIGGVSLMVGLVAWLFAWACAAAARSAARREADSKAMLAALQEQNRILRQQEARAPGAFDAPWRQTMRRSHVGRRKVKPAGTAPTSCTGWSRNRSWHTRRSIC